MGILRHSTRETTRTYLSPHTTPQEPQLPSTVLSTHWITPVTLQQIMLAAVQSVQSVPQRVSPVRAVMG
jgi:hypothetical protein